MLLPALHSTLCILSVGLVSISGNLQFSFGHIQGGTPDEIMVRPNAYNACMDVFDSDHKPVWASLAVDIPMIHHDKYRRLASHVLKAASAKATPPVPLARISTNSIELRQVRRMSCMLQVASSSPDSVKR